MTHHPYALAAASCALIIGLSACAGTSTNASDASMPEQTATQSGAMSQEAADTSVVDLTIIDVRTPEEYAEGHLEGAINIDIYAPDFEKQIKALDPSGNYAVYCRSGNRSSAAVALMEESGFAQVKDLGSREAASETLSTPIVK